MQRVQANYWYLLSESEGGDRVSRPRKWSWGDEDIGVAKIQNRQRHRRTDLEYSSYGKCYEWSWKLSLVKRSLANFRQDGAH